MNIKEVWKNLAHDVNELDRKIDGTNPFSPLNYCNKKYKDFFSYYNPEKRAVMVWVEDIEN